MIPLRILSSYTVSSYNIMLELDSLSEDSEDIYLQTKLETYLKRPTQLDSLTYPEFYQWWRSANQDEQKYTVLQSKRAKLLIFLCKPIYYHKISQMLLF